MAGIFQGSHNLPTYFEVTEMLQARKILAILYKVNVSQLNFRKRTKYLLSINSFISKEIKMDHYFQSINQSLITNQLYI